MNSLPNTSPGVPPTPVSVSGPAGGKEMESMPSSDLPIREIQKEIDLPKEVVSAGVSAKPTVIPIPAPVQRMGVQPAGNNVPMGNGNTVSLPLTQQQISQGLQKSMVDSWRWLAVWCIRRLKQFRFFQMKGT